MKNWLKLSVSVLFIIVCIGLNNLEAKASGSIVVSASPTSQTTETPLVSLTVNGYLAGGSTYKYKWVYGDKGMPDSLTYDWGSLTDTASSGQNLVVPTLPAFQNNGDYYLMLWAKDSVGNIDKKVYGPFNIKVDNSYIDIVASSNKTRLTTNDALDVAIDVTMPGGDLSVVDSVYYSWDGNVGGNLTLTPGSISGEGTASINGLHVTSGDTGTHRLDVSVTAGSDAKSVSYYYEYDDTKPVVSLTPDSVPGTAKKSHSVTVNLDASDANDRYYVSTLWSQIQYNLSTDTISWPNAVEQVGNQSYSSPANANGNWYFYAKVSDQAGNTVTNTVSAAFILDNTPPVLSLINGQAPACTVATVTGTVYCDSTASTYPTPIDPFFVNLTVDGKSGADLAGYTIQYHVVKTPSLYNWLNTSEYLDGGTQIDSGIFQIGGYLYTNPIHQRYVQFLITDPAGNQKLYLSDQFTIDPAYSDKFVMYPQSKDYMYINNKSINAVVYFKKGDMNISNMNFAYAIYPSGGPFPTVAEYITQEATGMKLVQNSPYFNGYYSANVQLDLSSWNLKENVQYEMDGYYIDPETGFKASSIGPRFIYDVTAPTISVTYDPPYDPSGAKVSSVTAAVYYSDDQMLSSGNKSDSEMITFNVNGTRNVTAVDAAGNTASKTLQVTWIKNDYTVTYSTAPGVRTNQPVVATIKFQSPVTFDDMSEPVLQRDYTINENGTYTLGYKDGAGVAGTINLSVDWIDQTPPTGSVFYTVNAKDHGVTATVIATDDSGEAPVLTDVDGNVITGDWTHTFTANGSYTFYFKDAAGNVGSATAEVTNFDTTPPVLSVIYSSTQLTNTNVRATVRADEPITVLNNNGSIYYDFEENGSFTFHVEDRFGNESSITATVDNIDKQAPVPVITYSTTETTKDNVVATVSVQDNTEFSVLNNYGQKSYVFKENGTFTFILADPAGNRVEATATVNNIDKSKVSYTLSYSESNLTKNDVTVTIVPEAGKTLHFPDNGDSPSVTFKENGVQWMRATDDLGNEYFIQMMVQWIDKKPPVITIDRDYIIAQSSAIPDLNAGVNVTDNFSDYTLTNSQHINTAVPGEYTVTYTATDKVGNAATATRKVTVVKASELQVYVNGTLVGNNMNINTNLLRIDVFGTRGQWELQGDFGEYKASHFKTGRFMLDPSQDVKVSQQGYYTIFVRDQELQQQVIHIYVIPQNGQGE